MENYMSKIHYSWMELFEEKMELLNNNINYINGINMCIYPSKENIFKVFEMDVNEIKVVFLGQDPYHGLNQAHGLSFSVNKDIKIPPSLQNIFKEIKNEYPERNYKFEHGNLERWFYEEKIFLLNSSLTVLEGTPGSFMKIWQKFTDDVIKYIDEKNKNCVFLLLGNFSKEKNKYIENKDRIVYGIHPSPLSAHKGFFGSNIFRELDKKLGYEINWKI
jgi:uracil-DNA glycosylase